MIIDFQVWTYQIKHFDHLLKFMVMDKRKDNET